MRRMQTGSFLVASAAILSVLSRVARANPGKWEVLQVEQGETKDTSTLGWLPRNRRFMIFGIKACKDAMVTMNTKSGQAYTMMYFGYQDNTYTVVIPSVDCDAKGSCNISQYAAGAFLDCNQHKFFWADWDAKGNFRVGTGFAMGQETMVALTGKGLTEEAMYMTFLSNDIYGGQMYLYVDDEPEFVDPDPRGTTELTLQETTATGTILYTVDATDPEGDNVTAFLMENTDLFDISGNDLTNVKPLDFETNDIIVLTLSINDQRHVVNTSLTIRLENVFDEAPSVDAVAVTIPEELEVGSYVDGGFTVSDIEHGDQLTYSLSGSQAGYFQITSDGRLKVASRIDLDPPTSLTKLDQLTLTVTDLGGNTNFTTLTLTVADVNDIKPKFSKSLYAAEVKEGSGTVSLLKLTVTDDDTGVNGDYDVTMTGDDVSDPKFTLAPGTLQLSVDANKLDYESLATEGFIYRLSLVATDKATDFQPLTATAVAIITILPDNEFTPVWTTAPTDQIVNETTSPGSSLGQYTATDDDLSKDGDVTYIIADVKDDQGTQRLDLFSLDSGTGDFILASPLDYDTATGGAAYYDVTVKAVDGGVNPKSVETTIRISVGAENDNPPVFADSLYLALVAEDISVNSAVLSVAATDADGDTLTYTVTGEGQGTFDYTTELINLKTLNFEDRRYYTFTLKASDGVHDMEVTVNVNVSNVIDETPVLKVISPLTLIEELPVGTPLGGVYDVTDIDEDDTLRYSLEGTDSSYFSINSTTGVISVAQRIDRDAGLTSITQVTLKVSDAGVNTASEPLSFTIIDINDNTPQFSNGVIYVNLTENTAPGTLLESFVVTDGDDGVNADVAVSIVSGDDANPNEKFELNGVDLKTRKTPVDYETLSDAGFQYTLSLQAVDKPTTEAAKTAVAVVVITVLPVNELTPVWTSTPADITLSESKKPGSIIAQYTATDDDLGEDGDVTYELVQAIDKTATVGTDKFHLDSGTGDFILASPLDFDTATGGIDYYDVTVKAVDRGANPKSAEKTFRISVGAENDNHPLFAESLYQASVEEDVSVNTAVLSVAATDADGDALTYTVTGEGQGTFDYTTELISLKKLDFEDRCCYTFILKVSDGVHETEVTINVNVSNVIDETPVLTITAPLTITEELPVGTLLGGVFNVTDSDNDDTLTYSLEGTESSYFNIDSTTGVISVAQRIDRDTGLTSITQVTLKVTDAGGNTASEPLSFNIVDINDNDPQFPNDVIFVNVTENTVTDQVILTLTCTDADDSGNTSLNFAIKSGDVAPDRFKLQGNDILTTGQAVNFEDPDVNSNMYILAVIATDTPATGSPNTAIVTVIVMVQPENEFSAIFSNPTSTGMTLSETTEPGHLVDTFIAIDDDNGDDGRLTYEITSVVDRRGSRGNGSVTDPFPMPSSPYKLPAGISLMSKFLIDEMSGKLRVAENLDVDVATGGVAYYDITVKVTDNGSPSKSETKDFRVTLQNKNDIAPIFVDFLSIIDVPENTSIGDVIMTLTTQDDDGDTVIASIVDGDTSIFSANGTDITLQQTLDYETSAGHIVIISITDGVHTLNDTLAVRVTDVIDETPVLQTFSPVYVTEERPVGTEVDGLFHVTDLDRGDLFTFTLNGSDSSYFSINSTSGQIKLSKRIDLESLAGDNILDQLTLTVEDQAGLQATGSLRVEILDINDAYPTFSQSVYKVNISENSSTEVLLDLVCNDTDSGTNGNITMQITDGDDPASSKFQLNGTELSALGADLDYEALEATQYMFILTVSATDAPVNESPKTGVTLVVVSVSPLNEFDPVWVSPTPVSDVFPSIAVTESATPLTTSLMTYNASDDDSGEHGQITYSIVSATTVEGVDASGAFFINPVNGNLWMTKEPDADIATGGTSSYELVIKAMDGGQQSIQANQTVHVINIDDNAPEIWTSDYSVEVVESSPDGTVVFSLNVSDIDGNNFTTTVIQGNEYFELNGSSVVTTKTLDYETQHCHTIVISASVVHDVNVTLFVSVTDVNDNPPEVTLHNSVSIPEELPVGTIIGGVYDVIDRDEGDSLTFTLAGADGQYLVVNSTSGELMVKSRMDRDGINGVTYLDNLTMTVSDSNNHSTVVNLNISVDDVNDNPPVCSQTVFVINITENSTDGLAAQINCTDPDDGDNGVFVLSITDGNDSGHINVTDLGVYTAGSSIDYEALDTSVPYIVSLAAVDQPTTEAARSAELSLILQVLPKNEHSPEWQSPSVDVNGTFPTQNLSETTAPGAVVVTVTAKDADRGTDGDVTYDILSAIDDNGKNRSSLFMIDQSQGIIRTSGELDHDQPGGIAKVELVIRASDDGGVAKTTTGTLIIDITAENDNAPVFTNLPTEIDVTEDTATGTVILNLQATDIDGDAVDFEVSGTEAHLFQINGSSLMLIQNIDYEQNQRHVPNLATKDGIYTTNVSITVNVVNVVDEKPEITLSTPLLLPEELPVGAVVGGFFSVNDPDVGDNLTYSLMGTGADYFHMNSSGAMSIAKRIDRDDPGDLTFIEDLTLRVTDTAGLTDNLTLNFTVIDINDNKPVCVISTTGVNVSENTSQDVTLTELYCTDPDGGDYGTLNITLDTSTDPNGHFNLSGTQLKTSAIPVDYESSADTEYMLTIRILVEDNPGGITQHTATTVISIKVLPVNEHVPVFTSPPLDGNDTFSDISLLENTTAGTLISIFNTTDDDDGEDGRVSYTIATVTTDSGSNAAGIFTLDSSTGELRVCGELDADFNGFYTVNILATDGGLPPLSTQGAMRVLVTGTNDNPPEWNISLHEVEVYENATVGDEVFSLAVTDVDGDTVTFTTSDTMFEIDGSKVKVKQQLDFEQERCHTITVSAFDGVHTVNESFIVHVLDSNDESPVISVTMAMLIPEELAVGTGVAKGYVVMDMDKNDILSYNLEGSDSSLLAINSTTGEITVDERMDFESMSSPGNLNITLRVTDSVGHTVTHPLNLVVNDINDNAPVFSQAVAIVTVTENATAETLVLTLTCKDPDSGNNGNFSFNISDGNNASLFRLDGDDLYIQSVDYETAQSLGFKYMLTIISVDHAVKPKTATTAVVVEILPVNEFDPEWQNPVVNMSASFPDLTLSERVLPGQDVITVVATDQDQGEDGHVVYSIGSIISDSGASADIMFTISSTTGVLSTSSQIDFDQSTGGAKYYDVTVTASDSGNHSRITTAVQRIILNNYNDIAPVFIKTLFKVQVFCNTTLGTTLTTLSAADADGPAIEYGIESGINAYVSVESSGVVSLKSSPTGSSVTDLAQSISIVASDKGTPELKTVGRLLVLFEKCGNTTSCETSTPVATNVNCTPCEHNVTITDGSTALAPVEEEIEAWAVRILCMVLALGLLASAILYFRPRSPPMPRARRVSHKDNPLERGISDAQIRRYTDLEQYIFHK